MKENRDSLNVVLLKMNEALSKRNKVLLKENEKLKNEIMEKSLEIIGIEEYTKANMKEIIEQYYTLNEECIPIQRIKDVFDVKIHNFNYLSKTDWLENQKYMDKEIANTLEIILEELLTK